MRRVALSPMEKTTPYCAQSAFSALGFICISSERRIWVRGLRVSAACAWLGAGGAHLADGVVVVLVGVVFAFVRLLVFRV